jgi:outer membrane protein TolC
MKKETFERQAKEQEELWDQWRSVSNAMTAMGSFVPASVTNPAKSTNAKIVKMTRPYLLTQAAIQYQMDIDYMAYDVTQIYYKVIQAQEGVKIAMDNLQNRKNILANTNKKFELGVVAKMDVLTAESAVMDAESKLSTAEVGLKSLQMSFNQKLDFPLMQRVVLTDSLKRSTQSAINLTGSIESALGKRNELNQLQYLIDKAQLILGEKYSISRYSAEYLSYVQDLKTAEKNLKDTKTLIELDIRAKYLNIINMVKEMSSLEKTIANAVEGYRLAELSYNAGMNTLVDVQTAQLGSYQAQLGLSNKILEYNLALSDLELVTGYGKPAGGGN